jgi:hypothetical protein
MIVPPIPHPRHSREGGKPTLSQCRLLPGWTPAFARVTNYFMNFRFECEKK